MNPGRAALTIATIYPSNISGTSLSVYYPLGTHHVTNTARLLLGRVHWHRHTRSYGAARFDEWVALRRPRFPAGNGWGGALGFRAHLSCCRRSGSTAGGVGVLVLRSQVGRRRLPRLPRHSPASLQRHFHGSH